MSFPPRVSVVMPARDAGPFIGEAVDSILSQSFGDLELIVVDDGSTDDSAALVERRAAADPRVRLMRQAAAGVVAALNRGCAGARGEYIARMDADDVARPERLQRQVAFLDRHPGIAVVGSGLQFLGDAGPLPRLLHLPVSPAAVRAALDADCCIAHPTVLMRRTVYAATGGYRAAFLHAEDYDLWLRIAERHDLANLDEPLLLHRLHRGQVSLTGLTQQVLSALAARAAARARRAGAPDPAPGWSRIDRPLIERIGLPPDAIDAALLDQHLARAHLFEELGCLEEADVIVAALDGMRLGRRGGDRRADIDWLRGKLELRRGRTLSGILAAGRAVLRRPSLLARLLRPPLRLLRRGAARRAAGPMTSLPS